MGTLQISVFDVAVILMYFVGVVMFGIWISRHKIHGGEDYFLAGREMTWPLVGASLFSTNISSQQFVGQAGLAFTLGIAAGAFQLMGAFCYVLLSVLFLETYMGLRLCTSPEFFERRFNAGCRYFVSGIWLLVIVFVIVASALYAGATVLMTLLGWESRAMLWTAVIVVGITTGAYTMFGGLRSVMYTDFVQTAILVLGGAVTLVIGVAKAGGVSSVLALQTADGSSMWNAVLPAGHEFGWLPMITGGLIFSINGHCTSHDYIQRVLAAKNLYHAKMGAMFAGLLKVLALFIIAAPGVVAARLFPDLQNGDTAYAHMLIDVLPIGLSGLCLAGLLAAIMSTVDSGLCAASSQLSYDFVKRWRPGISDVSLVTLGRLLILALLIFSILWAPFISHFEGLYKYLVQVESLIAPPIFVTVLFGLFYRPAHARAATATIMTGSLLGLAALAILNAPGLADVKAALPAYLQHSMNVGFILTLVCTAVMLVVTHTVSAEPEDKVKTEDVHASRRIDPMTARETVIYRATLALLLISLFVVMYCISPWGPGR
jgi:SSS family solute:Na+ symporter